MAYIIAQPAKDPEPYKPPVLNDDRQKEIDEQRKRVLKWKKRKREGTRPDEPGPPHNGQEPRWRDEYFVWGSEVGKDTLYWDEITGNWMNRDLFVEKISPDPKYEKTRDGPKNTLTNRNSSWRNTFGALFKLKK